METSSKPSATVVPDKATMDAQQKAGLFQAVTQLDMLLQFFPNAPKRVEAAGKEFRDALKEWADGKT